jgi:hypothetical protein
MPPSNPYCGTYACTSDGCRYRVRHADSRGQTLQMQRRARHDTDWQPPYLVEPAQIQRLLDYGSFLRETP